MVNHYYTESPEGLRSHPNTIHYTFMENNYTFHTDDGVFSKKYIDYGSVALIKAFSPNSLTGELLDMGAGYGVLGIILSRQYRLPVTLCEINLRAVELIKKNIEENHIEKATVFHSNLYSALEEDKCFASIVTNPPIRAGKQVVFEIYHGAYKHLLPNGELWVVIQKKQGAPSSKEFLTQLFGNCEIVERDKGYYILKSIKKN